MNNDYSNPFEHDAATSLSKEVLLQVYIGDYNFSRFLFSKKNLFLLGERGSGKTMHFLYHSHLYRTESGDVDFVSLRKSSKDIIGVYVPNETPLTFKREYELFESDLMKTVLSEHFLVTSIGHSLAKTLKVLDLSIEQDASNDIIEQYSYVTGATLIKNRPLFETLSLFFNKKSRTAQELLNRPFDEEFYHQSLTFSSTIPPLLDLITSLPTLKDAHFSFLIDDAHNLNTLQNKSLNSWIAYRNHSLFSFKVASKNRYNHDFRTDTGGAIIEGHDYTKIDLESFFYNSSADFGRLAKKLIEKRLELCGINKAAEDFFPTSQRFLEDLETCKQIAKQEAERKYPNGPKKSINDFVYKYHRVIYFRSRSPKANRPPYTGFDTLTNLSTGVVRNLLEPCYWMYDKQVSLNGNNSVQFIEPSVQQSVITDLSSNLWQKIQNNLAETVTDCSTEEALKVYNFFDCLAKLFRHRLHHHKSEPRAIMFSISGLTENKKATIFPVFDVAREALLLYQRMGTAKDNGQREIYYVPNRMLWPSRGLDPVGQFARVSVKADEIIASFKGHDFSYNDTDQENIQQEFDLD